MVGHVEQRECAVQRKKYREQNDATSIHAPDHEILGKKQYVGSTEVHVVELDSSLAHDELEWTLASPRLRAEGARVRGI
jgi:hypothetical protein